tara:strand:- start:183 stop:557 length:375 start_codon:yes stop_codon:yes gene_type:complete
MDLSDNIDILSLELMGNNKKYNNYMKKNNKSEMKRLNYDKELNELHREEILKITNDLLDNPNSKKYNYDIEKSFEYYRKNIIKDIELRNVEENNSYNQDEDMLFGNMEENKKTIPNFYSYTFNR